MVTSSPVSKLPVVGTIVEFGKSPVRMVQRCYEDYGPVFTVPVRELLCFVYVLCVIGGLLFIIVIGVGDYY